MATPQHSGFSSYTADFHACGINISLKRVHVSGFFIYVEFSLAIRLRGTLELHRNGAFLSEHDDLQEALEAAARHADVVGEGEYEVLGTYQIRVGRGSRYLAEIKTTAAIIDPNGLIRVPKVSASASAPTNTVPTVDSTPSPTFVFGAASQYDLDQHMSDADGDPVRSVINTGTVALPSGVTHQSQFNNSALIYDGAGAATTTFGHTLRADDGQALSSASNSFSIVISQPPATGAKRWHPGHGINITGQSAQPDQDSYWNSVSNQISNVSGYSFPFKHVNFSIALGVFDVGTTGPGTYDFSRLDPIVNQCASLGLYMNIQMAWKYFTSSSNSGFLAPTYLQDQMFHNTTGTGGAPTWIFALWRDGTDDVGNVDYDDVMGAFIAGMSALFNRYKDNPFVEIISHSEVVPSWGDGSNTPPDYTVAKFANQWKRLYSEIAALGSPINLASNANSLGNQITGSDGLMEHIYINRHMKGAPDTRYNPDDDVFSGTDPNSVRDYRGQIGHACTISTPDWSQSHPTQPDFEELGVDYVISDIIPNRGATHVYWTTNTNTSVTFTDIQNALSANPNTFLSDCPTRHISCDTS